MMPVKKSIEIEELIKMEKHYLGKALPRTLKYLELTIIFSVFSIRLGAAFINMTTLVPVLRK